MKKKRVVYCMLAMYGASVIGNQKCSPIKSPVPQLPAFPLEVQKTLSLKDLDLAKASFQNLTLCRLADALYNNVYFIKNDTALTKLHNEITSNFIRLFQDDMMSCDEKVKSITDRVTDFVDQCSKRIQISGW